MRDSSTAAASVTAENWKYEIRDNDTDNLLRQQSGFDSETDAETQGAMDAAVIGIKNCYVRTLRVRD